MRIIWDEPKRISNLEKHGLDFAALTQDFFLTAAVAPARAGRMKAIGYLADGTAAAIFVRLGIESVSVISLRSASKLERIQYEQTKAKTAH